ncbi:hypothetical protein QS430_02540 [Staphylococcus pseudintermedius]|nr:hypothetical protein QS430_02540 [Staphylococcus pseudintermedius]
MKKLRLITLLSLVCFIFLPVNTAFAQKGTQVFTEFVGLILIFMLRFKPANAVSKSIKFTEGMAESFKYVFKNRNLSTLFLTSSVINFLEQSLTVGLPIIIVTQLGYSSAHLGTMESILGVALLLTYITLNFFNMKNNLKKLSVLSKLILIVSLSLSHHQTFL